MSDSSHTTSATAVADPTLTETCASIGCSRWQSTRRSARMARTGLARLNEADPGDATALVLACAAVPRWARAIVEGRPYADADAALTAARTAAVPWTPEEVDAALARHPRIGERVRGDETDAAHSREEQAGVDPTDAETARRLAAGNAAYEARFGHVFLIRAGGRTGPEILAALEQRLTNDPVSERLVVAEQLREIAVLRLAKELGVTPKEPEMSDTRSAGTTAANATAPDATAAIVLGDNQYGKAEVRLLRVDRDTPRHRITELSVTSQLRGDFASAHLVGDNAPVVATDTQKNTVFALAKDGVGAPEEFALRLAEHFTSGFDWVSGGRWLVKQYTWERIPTTLADNATGGTHDHAFVKGGTETRTAVVQRDGDDVFVVAGLEDLSVLKSTGSEFHGFPRDRYTTLAETDDRILATSVTARWRYTTADVDYDALYADVRRLLLETFADVHSFALQQTLYKMGERVLHEHPEIGEIRFSMPNLHHFLVDLAPFGMDNPGEVFYAADRPYGLIEAEVRRSDVAPDPRAWATVAGFC
ncbi:urate oxidase [Georgenia yuyongxinii]|uniref:factor independent urate hydroxylase n=2 Tax=Georgenia yuyongxinii TaxID=2589797 RepID=A0A5B8C463_9MICO|nr:urate oxidase [Georgenia yuyongxinii]